MEQQYFEVPDNIITGKDLDYLSDMFNWNYEGLKKTAEALNNVSSEDIINILESAEEMFDSNLNTILDILNNGGATYE